MASTFFGRCILRRDGHRDKFNLPLDVFFWGVGVGRYVLKILHLYHFLPCNNINRYEVCLVRWWKFENMVFFFRVEGSVPILCRFADTRYREGQSLFFFIIKRVVSLI
jgi:hypothetical protein